MNSSAHEDSDMCEHCCPRVCLSKNISVSSKYDMLVTHMLVVKKKQVFSCSQKENTLYYHMNFVKDSPLMLK